MIAGHLYNGWHIEGVKPIPQNLLKIKKIAKGIITGFPSPFSLYLTVELTLLLSKWTSKFWSWM